MRLINLIGWRLQLIIVVLKKTIKNVFTMYLQFEVPIHIHLFICCSYLPIYLYYVCSMIYTITYFIFVTTLNIFYEWCCMPNNTLTLDIIAQNICMVR